MFSIVCASTCLVRPGCWVQLLQCVTSELLRPQAKKVFYKNIGIIPKPPGIGKYFNNPGIAVKPPCLPVIVYIASFKYPFNYKAGLFLLINAIKMYISKNPGLKYRFCYCHYLKVAIMANYASASFSLIR